MEKRRLAVISNRLPIVLKKEKRGRWQIEPGSGGLVTALGPVLKHRDGIWIGWIGTNAEETPAGPLLADLLSLGTRETGYSLKPVNLSREEIDKYYYGFSNEILWPLFHDLFSRCSFKPSYWAVYEQVNKKFAKAVIQNTDESDYVWVQDYHLILVGRELKRLGVKRQTGFFLHIPFPPLDIFLKLPWRFEILEALLEYDLVGFQTVRDLRNFIGCVRALFGYKLMGSKHLNRIILHDREVLVGAFPISIDYREFEDLARTGEVAETAWIIHANLPKRQLILGVDRLDYTKGIPERLLAFGHALERYPDMRRKVTLIQVVVPSRGSVEEYAKLKQEIECIVGEVNGKYTDVGWTPIHYIYRSLPRPELVAYYKTCEIALITPLKDGMNLIAKEYCASNTEEKGVLILSEFAGAASQLHQNVLLVNPYDRQRVADAIHTAFLMPHDERQARMKRLRRSIQKNDIINWVNSFLQAGIAQNLGDFPQAEFFVPSPETDSDMASQVNA
ncbi:MAG TPA: trehalose-6-phosphate synthase [Deltaproteobacteria bacterium]|nr:trehalose-6-phosphate synthase [Deltaproteobacteria bacterium]